MEKLFTGMRAVFYASGFVLLWGWFVQMATRADRQAGRALPVIPVLSVVGTALVVAGSLLALTCAVLFVARGEGTPAPFDAPRRFVAAGPYRFVRNPMYVGAITLLVGIGLVLRAPSVFGVAFAAFFFSNLFVIFVEEPGLTRRFGETYLAYRRATNRWIPRLARAG
ncbi:MAG: methyltransferase family protein [Thermoanaerobaculia bacterium]